MPLRCMVAVLVMFGKEVTDHLLKVSLIAVGNLAPGFSQDSVYFLRDGSEGSNGFTRPHVFIPLEASERSGIRGFK